MSEMLNYFTQFMIAYFLLGGLLLSIVALPLTFLSLSAAARHKIWLVASIVLVLAPTVTLLPLAANEGYRPVSVTEIPAIPGSEISTSSLKTDKLDAAAVSLTVNAEDGSDSELQLDSRTAGPSYLESLSFALLALPYAGEFVLAAIVILILAMASKLTSYMRSLRALRELIDTAEKGVGDWEPALQRSLATMNLNRRVRLLHSSDVSTPSTCGVLNPCIILPSTMVLGGYPERSRAQLIQHELAHIKRHDPLVAGIQALLEVFYFWHPAFNYIVRKIRHEREIACDDWVVSHSKHQGSAAVRAYAYSLVSVAEALRKKNAAVHTLACVDNVVALNKRIKILLDSETDHSTSVNLAPNLLGTTIAFSFIYCAFMLLPRPPHNIFMDNIGAGVQAPPALSETVSEDPQIVAERFLEDETNPKPAEPLLRQLADYAAPSPIPATGDAAIIIAPDALYSRAESLKSAFRSKLPVPDQVDTIVLEPEKLTPSRLDLDPLDDRIEPASRLTSNVLEGAVSSQVGSASRSELEAEILRVELELYRVFNALTDRGDLKMYCDTQTDLGSYISHTTCEPEFLRTARSEMARDSLERDAFIPFTAAAGLTRDMKTEYAELASELLKEIKNNPYLLELYKTLAALRGQLAAKA